MTSERILLIHWAPDHETHVAACGESVSITYIDGKARHYRHVYVTLSTSLVNCVHCTIVLGMCELAKVQL